MKRAARYGDGWLPYMYTPEQLAASAGKIGRSARRRGRDLSGFRYGLYVFTAVHEDGDRAREMAAARLGPPVRPGFLDARREVRARGNPDEVRARLREYVDAGARLVMLSSACPDDYIDENVRLIAEEVLPAFR